MEIRLAAALNADCVAFINLYIFTVRDRRAPTSVLEHLRCERSKVNNRYD